MSGCCGPILVSNGTGTTTDPITDVEYVTLCDVAADGTSTAFLRRFVHAQDGTLSSTADLALDGATAYTPTGTVTVCTGDTTTPPVTTQTASTHRQVLTDPTTFDVFAAATGTVESVTVTVIAAGTAGPSVTTASGTSRVYGGESVTWSALPDVAAGSDELTGPLSVTTTDGDTVAVSWTERP
ncbi:hypothetical protein [Streptomyces sp. TRM68367]|uniref:hypothetical protein n=1 Tax=Streptomyces sp. TRM68367 TaxID=2758415 RepID=UPI00165A9EEE|nr:hypothetical protein [Streptomyces sp. TRM68367]MBC9729267.1 hypothetical protein [Streptomyces sp. TRM68367]